MSTIKANNIEEATSGGATYFLNRAWVNFNGSGTVSIRDDGNVSSLTDMGTARYKTNWSTAFANTNYCVTGQGRDTVGGSALPYTLSGASVVAGSSVVNTGFVDCRAVTTSDALRDSDIIMLLGIN